VPRLVVFGLLGAVAGLPDDAFGLLDDAFELPDAFGLLLVVV